MDINPSCTADAFSEIGNRLLREIQGASNAPEGQSDLNQVKEVQTKIEELKRAGFLKRQEYAAAKTADFQKIFARKT
jgi:hypothetical protein